MEYAPRTVLVGGITRLGERPPLLPPPVKAKYQKGKAGYLVFGRSVIAQKMMAMICATPGTPATSLWQIVTNRVAYGYLDCLRRDGYATVTMARNANNVPVMHVWPTELFFEHYPPKL